MNVDDAIKALSELYVSLTGKTPSAILPVAASGSGRRYYRLVGDDKTIVGTCGPDAAENAAFIYLSRHFSERNIPVPKVLAVSDDGLQYLQSDCGEQSLFEVISVGRSSGIFSSDEKTLLQKSLQLLLKVQFEGAEGLAFSRCYPQAAMNDRMVTWDLNYFKYCFLKPVLDDLDEERLQDELDSLATRLKVAADSADSFMVRDFQSRNLLVDRDGNISLIDFQGGRRGPVEYDVASFLWQAKASIPQDLRHELVDYYVECASAYKSCGFNEATFRRQLPYFVLFRVLQTLGAYGFRGLTQRKPHFLSSIGPGINNLAEVLAEFSFEKEFPYLVQLASLLVSAEAVKTLSLISSVPATSADVLTINVSSFSFKHGVPADLSGNGGGYVFDCRAIHNPGRYEQYKAMTGRDDAVKRFLEDDGEVFTFLNAVYALVDASVSRYLKRGFSSLCVAFGCTGGQHRSVYCAESLVSHLHAMFPMVRIVLWHREQNIVEVKDPVSVK